MSGVLDTLTKRRDAHFELFSTPTSFCRCGDPWPCPDRVALDAELASLNKTTEHLEAIRDDCAGMPGHTARRSFDHAVAALALLAPNHNNTQNDNRR